MNGGIIIFEYSCFDNKEILISKCAAWVRVPELEILVEQFGGKIPLNLEVEEKIRWLVDFSETWDFRKMQNNAYDSKTGEKARWLVDNAALSELQISATLNAAKRLGMIDCTLPTQTAYDYILVLGGARMSCLFRMRYARELCEHYGIAGRGIIGLTGMRPIADSERSATDTYAPDAGTEFDLMCAAVENVFKTARLDAIKQTAEGNFNSSWAITQYKCGIPITVLAAPSSEPVKRRANTADTFTFLEEKMDIHKGKRLLLVTSQIYVPYQQLEAVRMLGFEYGHSVETVGFPREWSANMQGLQTAANYLQEIRSALLAMNKLL